MNKTTPHLILFFGSQTGNAEDFSNRFAQQVSSSLSIPSLVLDLEDFDLKSTLNYLSKPLPVPESTTQQQHPLPHAHYHLVGFFLATYGEGEPTDNASEFYEWIMGDTFNENDDGEDTEDTTGGEEGGNNNNGNNGDPFENLSYIIFGLGNKTYEHFNAMARRVDKRLTRWGGAKRIGPRGEGDDDGNLEDNFIQWKSNVMQHIAKYFGIQYQEDSLSISKNTPHRPAFELLIGEKVHELSDGAPCWGGEHSASGIREWVNGKEVSTER